MHGAKPVKSLNWDNHYFNPLILSNMAKYLNWNFIMNDMLTEDCLNKEVSNLYWWPGEREREILNNNKLKQLNVITNLVNKLTC